jgi:hypothetical protein
MIKFGGFTSKISIKMNVAYGSVVRAITDRKNCFSADDLGTERIEKSL